MVVVKEHLFIATLAMISMLVKECMPLSLSKCWKVMREFLPLRVVPDDFLLNDDDRAVGTGRVGVAVEQSSGRPILKLLLAVARQSSITWASRALKTGSFEYSAGKIGHW